jgi:tetratricopeptide (TPR) repeat protein
MDKHEENGASDRHATKDFFISYAVENWVQAKWIQQQLEDHGYRTILAGRDFSAGNNFVLEMDNALKTSAAMIAVMSPEYLASPYTQAEWAAVFPRDPTGARGLIIPVLIRPCEVEGLLKPLLRINLIDLIGKDDQQAQKRLLRGVRGAPRTRSLASSPSSKEISLLSSRIWHVPFSRNPLFTGREDLLDQLHQKLTMAGTSNATTAAVAALTQPQALKGLGGIGKTQLAIEYAYRYQDDYPHTFWINAATEEALITSFVTIAGLLPSFPAKHEQDQHKIVEAVKHWLEQSRTHWLLLFDNADDIALVRSFLPKNGPGHILLTTRAHAVGSFATSIEVEKMSLMEGSCLLIRRVYGLASHLSPMQVLEYASVEDTNEAANVVAALDYLPLALDQAGAYIEETGCGFAGYLNVYNTHRKELLARRGTQATEYPEAVATTWSLSFQKVEQANPAAAELLRLCAFLAPDKIPEELIIDGADQWSSPLQQAAADHFTFNQMIADLLKFSLVRRLAETQAFSIHRLVQAVQRDGMELEVQHQWAERVVRAVSKVFPHDVDDVATWPLCLRYLDQAQACNSLIEQYILTFSEGANLLNRTGLYLCEHALYTIAEPLHQRAYLICEQQLGTEHLSTVACLNNLALLYQAQGRYELAEPLLQQALSLYEQQMGATHLKTATSLNNLADLYWHQGKYEEAEPLLKRALMIREQQLGPFHPDTATSLNNLAHLYQHQGKYEEAEPLYQRALVIQEQQLGPFHPNIAISVNSLAHLYRHQGKYEEAEPLYQRALVIREQQLGPSHPDTAESLNSLALLYDEQEKYEEAEPLYQRALAIHEQRLGPLHPDTAVSLNNLALLYHNRGKHKEAEVLLKRALAIYEQRLGPLHPDTAISLNSLAFLYDEQGNYEEAEPLYQRALAICERVLGRKHPSTQTVRANYALLLYTMGRNDEARKLEEEG